jgi:hypothetical protein
LLRNIENPIKFNYTFGKHKETQTIEAIEAAWKENEALWTKSNDCAALKTQLANHAGHLIGQVKKIVCFGLGSLHWDERYSADQRATSFVQHAAIKSLQEFFGRSSVCAGIDDVHQEPTQAIRALIQDPWYSEVDKEFLTRTGFTVIDNPKGFLEVDEGSLVFSVSPNVPVKQIVADMARPAAMLWNTVEKHANRRAYHCTDPDSARVRAMVESYEQFPLQEDDMPHFWDCTLYLRKSGSQG